jgi:23S rRNA (guanosine2251-2'-O)-methyltransferase
MPDQLEGRNVVLEALVRQRRPVLRIAVDERARPEPRLDQILRLARERRIPVRTVPRQELDRRSQTGAHNGIIADAASLPDTTVARLLEATFERGEDPFLVLADELSYEHNLGAVLRSALGAGAHGVVVPTRRSKGMSPVVARVAMGAAEEVPVVREGLQSALKICRRQGLLVVGADMGGRPYYEVDLSGPLALVMGGESKGLSPALRNRCDHIVSVPLAGGLESLNVSVTAGILMFERARQRALRGQ